MNAEIVDLVVLNYSTGEVDFYRIESDKVEDLLNNNYHRSVINWMVYNDIIINNYESDF